MDGVSHYYGDTVRKLFLAAGVVMLVSLPFFDTRLPLPATIALLAVLAVTVVAGLTNPRQLWVMWLNVIVSLGGIIVFEYHAIVSSGTGYPVWLFVVDQALALLFFFALYYSVKTLRGQVVPDERGQQPPIVYEEPTPPENEHPRGSSGLMK